MNENITNVNFNQPRFFILKVKNIEMNVPKIIEIK